MRKNIFVFMFCAIIGLTACGREDRQDEVCVTFAATISGNTKVYTSPNFKSVFTDGDQIGVFAVRHADGVSADLRSSGNYVHNMKLTYLAGAWTSERPVYFPNNGDLLDFYAYHPYEEGVDPTGIVFSVGEDQSSQSKFSRSDLMKTYSCENVKIRQPVNLSFYHTLALVHIEVLGASDPGLTATLLSCMPETRMNLADNLPLSGSGTTVEIAMLRLEEDPQTATSYTYRAIVPAQTIAAGTVFALFEGAGKKYEMKLQSEFRLRASVVEPVSVSIP